VTSQLEIPAKRQKFGPKAVSREWWIQRIKDTPGPKYTQLWTHLPEYHLLTLKALAELDYQVLGKGVAGAPDDPELFEEGEHAVYPVKIIHKPHWLPTLNTIKWKDFQVWSWIGTVKALESPLSKEADIWHNYLDLEQTKLEAVEVLGIFKPEHINTELPADIEWELVGVPAEAEQTPISSIKFEIPEGRLYRYLNNTLNDPRPIPVTSTGLVIRKKFLKLYIEERLQEYLALGGTQELIVREQFLGIKIADPFYWNLWADLAQVRNRYTIYCAQEHIDPVEEDVASVASWDTQ
jgi:hypothetical protein